MILFIYYFLFLPYNQGWCHCCCCCCCFCYGCYRFLLLLLLWLLFLMFHSSANSTFVPSLYEYLCWSVRVVKKRIIYRSLGHAKMTTNRQIHLLLTGRQLMRGGCCSSLILTMQFALHIFWRTIFKTICLDWLASQAREALSAIVSWQRVTAERRAD